MRGAKLFSPRSGKSKETFLLLRTDYKKEISSSQSLWGGEFLRVHFIGEAKIGKGKTKRMMAKIGLFLRLFSAWSSDVNAPLLYFSTLARSTMTSAKFLRKCHFNKLTTILTIFLNMKIISIYWMEFSINLIKLN